MTPRTNEGKTASREYRVAEKPRYDPLADQPRLGRGEDLQQALQSPGRLCKELTGLSLRAVVKEGLPHYLP